MTQIQFRRGTASQWTTANPVLAAGELGFETDTKEFKIGDGASLWSALAYWISDVASHTHTASQISDSTITGRALITAVDQAAARTAIGAGTSNLAIGTTGSTAMVGNKTFAFSEITGVLGTAQLPPLAVNEVFTPADQTAMLALTAQRGDIAIRVDNGKTYILSTDSPSTLADWKIITAVGDVTSVAGRTGAVALTKTDVGLSNVDNTSDAAKPVSTAQATSIATKEPTLAAGTTAQYYRGDKTWVTLDKAAAGLGNVDNTSDANKPVSTAQQTALNLKANLAGPTFTGTVSGITATMVGLGSVNNTTDAAKPVSTAQQTALNLKADLAGPTFTGTVNGITKTMVGLGNVDNTSDVNKPVSTATTTALAGKANTSHTHVAADILSVDGGTP
jgi:hypothetical protein